MSKATGLDYLVKEVGTEIMPPYAGWTPTELYDKILFDKDFSIKEVVEATVKVLSQKLTPIIEEIIQDENAPTIYKCDKEIKPFTKEKRLILTDGITLIATSSWVRPLTPIVYEYEGVRYYQAGHLGRISASPINKLANGETLKKT